MRSGRSMRSSALDERDDPERAPRRRARHSRECAAPRGASARQFARAVAGRHRARRCRSSMTRVRFQVLADARASSIARVVACGAVATAHGAHRRRVDAAGGVERRTGSCARLSESCARHVERRDVPRDTCTPDAVHRSRRQHRRQPSGPGIAKIVGVVTATTGDTEAWWQASLLEGLAGRLREERRRISRECAAGAARADRPAGRRLRHASLAFSASAACRLPRARRRPSPVPIARHSIAAPTPRAAPMPSHCSRWLAPRREGRPCLSLVDPRQPEAVQVSAIAALSHDQGRGHRPCRCSPGGPS